MSKVLRRMSLILVGLFVVGGLAFGVTTLAGDAAVEECGDDLGEIGTCPPLNPTSCNEACMEEFFGGDCVQGCCTCLT